MAALVDLLTRIPSEAYAAVGAVILTLSGVWVQNYFETRRQRERLAAQERLEQIATLRRDVYLPYADATARMGQFLGNLLRLDLPRQELGKGLEFAAQTQRVWAFASMRTLKDLKPVSDFFLEAAIDLISERIPIEKQIESVEQVEEELRNALIYRRQLEVAVKASTDIVNQELVQLLEGNRQKIQQLMEGRSKLIEKRDRLYEDFFLKVLNAAKGLAERVVEVSISIRKELGIDTDPVLMRELQADSGSRILEKMKRVIDEGAAGEVEEESADSL